MRKGLVTVKELYDKLTSEILINSETIVSFTTIQGPRIYTTRRMLWELLSKFNPNIVLEQRGGRYALPVKCMHIYNENFYSQDQIIGEQENKFYLKKHATVNYITSIRKS